MYDELSQLDEALNGLDNLRLQLPERIAAAKDPALAERARGVLAEAQRVEGTISSQPVNDQDDDFLEDLLRERVLTFISDLGPGAPPPAQLARRSAAARGRGRAGRLPPLRGRAGRRSTRRCARPACGARPGRAAGQDKPDPDADEHARAERVVPLPQ